MADHVYTVWRAKPDSGDKRKRYKLYCHQSKQELSFRYSQPLWSIANVMSRADHKNDHHVIRIVDRAGRLIYEETIGWARKTKLKEIELGDHEYSYPCFVDMSEKD